ncbi:MAG: hypothetical protein [Microviridae sp.]|nr:MAG: hypothetical protein [Microviridae sp.]
MSKRHSRRQRDTTDIARTYTLRDADAWLTYSTRYPDISRSLKHYARDELIDAYWESLPEVEDTRRWDPLEVVNAPERPGIVRYAPRTVGGGRARVIIGKTQPRGSQTPWRDAFQTLKQVYALPHRIGFQTPHLVPLCIRRRIRKEVLHALGMTGKGHGGAGKPRKVDETSKITC